MKHKISNYPNRRHAAHMNVWLHNKDNTTEIEYYDTIINTTMHQLSKTLIHDRGRGVSKHEDPFLYYVP